MTKLFALVLATFCCCLAAVVAVKTDSRVIGGSIADLGDFPWQAAIYYSGIYICAGTLIDLKHVITAYDCLQPYESFANLLSVNLGVVVAANATNSKTGVKVKMGTLFNKLAILEIMPVETADVHLTAIYYKANEDVQTGDHAFISGWGMTDTSIYYDLRWVEVTVDRLLSSCRDPKFFCTFGYNINGDHIGPCKWDIGTGLVDYNENLERYVLIGVLTFASCEKPTEAEYSSTYTYKGWIDQQLNTAA